MSLAAQIAAQAERAARPAEQALALPAEVYGSPALFAHERETIFARSWTCGGRIDDIAPGAFACHSIAGRPIVLIRDRQGLLRGFLNACRHRGARLLQGDGPVGRVTCPYHAWTYEPDGRLIGAPHMPDLDKSDLGLLPIAVETWAGFVFANLDAAAAPLSPTLAPLGEALERLNAPDAVRFATVQEEWPVDWKIAAENFMESYHLFAVHRDTVETWTPTQSVTPLPGGDNFAWHSLRVHPDRVEHDAYAQALDPDLVDLEILACVFPTLLLAVNARQTLWVVLDPIAPDRTKVSVHLAAPAELIPSDGAARAAWQQAQLDHLERFSAEDRFIVSAVAEGLRAPGAGGGPLSPLERPLWDFHRFLARMLSA
jgi:choline monooxygenase